MLNHILKHNILILLIYYNRPELVKNAIRSIIEADKYYPHWHLIAGDDNSDIPLEPIAKDLLAGYLHKVTFMNSYMSMEEKIKGGLRLGLYLNAILETFNYDAWITLCDDDQLHEKYLYNLNRFFIRNPKTMYCYSNIELFNPIKETKSSISGFYNEIIDDKECLYHLVDGSQTAFRSDCFRKYGARYPNTTKSGNDPWKLTPDGEFFLDLYRKGVPKAKYTGFVSQYKGIHDYQMVHLKELVFTKRDDILKFKDELL